ncbi:uncharacterized protein PFL1_06266 [Pseudozyma flocculosa PF-1]|nr:uncharacterized protein PFL1_06266 [Pseudozyma flocculosa PF-1]EPQ26057.1 hypothetical protein PFL1_06266 [Pseudozyma flocculosa PF-1]
MPPPPPLPPASTISTASLGHALPQPRSEGASSYANTGSGNVGGGGTSASLTHSSFLDTALNPLRPLPQQQQSPPSQSNHGHQHHHHQQQQQHYAQHTRIPTSPSSLANYPTDSAPPPTQHDGSSPSTAGNAAGSAGAGPSASASTSASASASAVAGKVSCLACRAAKRKCHTAGIDTVCKRCHLHRIPCEYKQHRRGRTKRPRPPSDAAAGTAQEQQRPGHAGPSSSSRRSNANESASTSSAARDIRFSHLVSGEGDSSPYMSNPRSSHALSRQPNTPLPRIEQAISGKWDAEALDPISAGILSEADAYELFDHYFRCLNVTLALLDPALHTADHCRTTSPLLFTGVLAVTAKIARPAAYDPCLALANRLLGRAFEHGECSVEFIQVIHLLAHWRKGNDSSSFRRIGFATRMAQELRLFVPGPRPLPSNERAAREILNKERTWLTMIIADYNLAIHHSLPKIISEDDIGDPEAWASDHPQYPCRGEETIAPMIQFIRMASHFFDTMAGLNGDSSNLRTLDHIETQWRHWRKRWIEDEQEEFTPLHFATLRMSDALFRFHALEYRLLFNARYRAKGQTLDTSQPTQLSYDFGRCIDAGMMIADGFLNDVARPGFLPYCFHLAWVAMIISSIWLIKNIDAINPNDRAWVIRKLSEVRAATDEASRSSDDMAGYTTRLLQHMLDGLCPEWHLNCLAETAAQSSAQSSSTAESSSGGSSQLISTPKPDPASIASTHEIIQGHLWGEMMHSSAFAQPTCDQPMPPAMLGNHPGAVNMHGGDGGVNGHNEAMPLVEMQSAIVPHSQAQHHESIPPPPQQQQHQQQQQAPAPYFAAAGPPQPNLFPADDDEFWRMLFPKTGPP